MKDISQRALNIADLREIARRNLPKGVFEFVDRGNEDEVGLRNNRAVFERIKLRPRRLVDVSARTQSTMLFGKELKIPIAIAPTGSGGLMCYEGELAQARAAAAAGIPFSVATGSMTGMERVVAEAGGRLWFQLYMWADRTLSHQLVKRASDAGYEALVVTIDSAVASNREYNVRNGYTVPFTFNARNTIDVLMHPGWMFGVLGRYIVTTGMPRYENYPSARKSRITAEPMDRTKLKNDSLNWEDLRTLRKLWPRTLIVKGILCPEDALLAADCGADAVVVSNHGGRNFDSYQAPIEVLPEVVDAVGKRLTVLVDSGFRRGTDIVKALAMGAAAVLVGRPTLYGTAAAGEAGARHAISILRKEIDRAMAHLGCNSVSELNRNHLRSPESFSWLNHPDR